jgi:hypothetical protein
LSFCDWLILLSVTSSRFILLQRVSEFPSYLKLSSVSLSAYVAFRYSSVKGHLGCFRLMAIGYEQGFL